MKKQFIEKVIHFTAAMSLCVAVIVGMPSNPSENRNNPNITVEIPPYSADKVETEQTPEMEPQSDQPEQESFKE